MDEAHIGQFGCLAPCAGFVFFQQSITLCFCWAGSGTRVNSGSSLCHALAPLHVEHMYRVYNALQQECPLPCSLMSVCALCPAVSGVCTRAAQCPQRSSHYRYRTGNTVQYRIMQGSCTACTPPGNVMHAPRLVRGLLPVLVHK